MVLVLVLQVLERAPRLLEYFLFPGNQLLAEIVPLAIAHEWFFFGRTVDFSVGFETWHSVFDTWHGFETWHSGVTPHEDPRLLVMRGELISGVWRPDNMESGSPQSKKAVQFPWL
jgi:hypothetical protein